MAALAAVVQAEPLRGFGQVERPVSRGINSIRDRRKPPVDEVEVMGRLVNHEATGVLLISVPPPEVVSAVMDIEEPVEVH